MWFSTSFSRTGHSFDKMHNFSRFSPFEILFKTSVRTKLSTFSFLRFCGKSRLIHQVIHIIHIFYPQFHGLHWFFRKQMFCVFIIIAFSHYFLTILQRETPDILLRKQPLFSFDHKKTPAGRLFGLPPVSLFLIGDRIPVSHKYITSFLKKNRHYFVPINEGYVKTWILKIGIV